MTETEEFRLLWRAHLRALPEAEGRAGEPLTPEEKSLLHVLARGEASGGVLDAATYLAFEKPAAMELLVALLRERRNAATPASEDGG